MFGTQSPPDEFRERQGGCVCSNQTDSSLSLCAFLYFFLYVQHKNSNIILSVSALWIRRRVWELIFLLLSDFESLWTHFQVVQIDGGSTITPRRENSRISFVPSSNHQL